MGKVSNLYKFRKENTDMAQSNLDYVIKGAIRESESYTYMSRGEFAFIFFRYSLALLAIIFLMEIVFPDLIDEVLSLSVTSIFIVLSLVMLLPSSYRLANQQLSPYLLVFHLLPLGCALLPATFTLPIIGLFLLYLISINVFDIKPPACERRKQLASALPDEYPFGLTLACFSLLYISFFLLFELDDAIICLMLVGWLFFLLAKWHWPVVILNVLGVVGMFWFFSSGFLEVKHHKNIIINALIKISLLDNILFLIFSFSLFINMLYWLEAWQRERHSQPHKE
ncbi:hypothetical protein [Yersinia rohdei]|uniref:hypothetical protein n=1 Tax=Yersinia rohdei TaxID=29485 RepID=UPI00119DC317|nr:hypothetical protein [Yersinia rohdei]